MLKQTYFAIFTLLLVLVAGCGEDKPAPKEEVTPPTPVAVPFTLEGYWKAVSLVKGETPAEMGTANDKALYHFTDSYAQIYITENGVPRSFHGPYKVSGDEITFRFAQDHLVKMSYTEEFLTLVESQQETTLKLKRISLEEFRSLRE